MELKDTVENDRCVYCTLLNRYDNPKLNELIWVHAGDLVFATDFAEEFGFTSGFTYEIINCSYDSILVKNDNGDENWMSVEYFEKV